MAKLYFYYSAMNAGKSTVLLQSAYNYKERGMNTLLFTPHIDTRFQKGMIHSRIGLSEKATMFEATTDLFSIVKTQLADDLKLSCILIDEAQFLTKNQVMQLTDIVDQLNIPVLTYGLRSDFRGEPFEGSLYLLILADNIIEIKTICFCGKKAIMNARVDSSGQAIKSGEQIHIAGNEAYIPMCRKHYKEKMQQ